MPSWVLRVRPYSVFSIPLASVDYITSRHGNTCCHQDVVVRWLESQAERSELEPIVDPANLAAWNGVTRRVVVAWLASQPIGVAWIATESFSEPHLGLHIDVAQDDAWLHSAFVAPAWRRQGVYRSLLQYVIGSLQVEGYRRLLLGVTTGNEPSRRAHSAAGATKIGRISAVRSCGLTFCLLAGKVCCFLGGRVGFGRSVDLRIDG